MTHPACIARELVLTQARLMEVLHYCAETGLFTWITSHKRGVSPGKRAGSVTNHGYVSIRVDDKPYLAHRLAWLYVYGELPVKQIDHINGIRTDNRIQNLRECFGFENQQNMKRRIDNSSGLTNVSFHRQTGKWRSYITSHGRSKFLGLYQTKELAYEAYLSAKRDLHTFNPVPRSA